MKPQQPDFILNLSASPFAFDHAAKRIHTCRANVKRYEVPIFYVNHVGAQTDIIFDGGSVVVSPDGTIFDEMPYFEECLKAYNLEEVLRGGKNEEQTKNKIQLIHDALVIGIKDYFQKMGLRRAILGLSGGIDSAVVAVLAARALGAENVRCILMPSQFSSDHSVQDARQLAQNLNIQYDLIQIEPVYEAYMKTLQPHFVATPFNLTEENLQARIRGMLLMAMSNKFGNILLNTSNKSEMAVGYGTLYGDMCGGISVIGDVYKTDVYKLARYMNHDSEVIPEHILVKAPSAELRPNQKDSDSLPDYDVLDEVLYQYIELRKSPNELISQGFHAALVQRILRLVNINEFKREQTAPVLRVSSKAFGMGRRMPIVGKYLS
jgi:NAD+ synthase (glutamine-hydrolysing)